MQEQFLPSLRKKLDEVLVRVPSFESKEELEKLLLSLVQEYKPECVLLTGIARFRRVGEWQERCRYFSRGGGGGKSRARGSGSSPWVKWM